MGRWGTEPCGNSTRFSRNKGSKGKREKEKGSDAPLVAGKAVKALGQRDILFQGTRQSSGRMKSAKKEGRKYEGVRCKTKIRMVIGCTHSGLGAIRPHEGRAHKKNPAIRRVKEI